MRPVLEPNNIYAHRHEEQDVILWYNRALWHSIVSLPIHLLQYLSPNNSSRLNFQSHMGRGLCINVMLQLPITQ
jgi:hypothetical protein